MRDICMKDVLKIARTADPELPFCRNTMAELGGTKSVVKLRYAYLLDFARAFVD